MNTHAAAVAAILGLAALVTTGEALPPVQAPAQPYFDEGQSTQNHLKRNFKHFRPLGLAPTFASPNSNIPEAQGNHIQPNESYFNLMPLTSRRLLPPKVSGDKRIEGQGVQVKLIHSSPKYLE